MSIYVEILIRSSMDNLWEKTQNPKLHQRWDLRFSEIDYLPRKPGEAQEFLYATRIGGGLRIEGAGESTGERDDASGQRTSALKFWSDDPKSLIKLGSGYWKYIPEVVVPASSLSTTIGHALALSDESSIGSFFVLCSAGRRHGASIDFGFGSKKVSCQRSLVTGRSSTRCLA